MKPRIKKMKEKLTAPLFMIGSFLIAFALYVVTLAPSVTFTDSGELAAVAQTLGIAHPTGYPLYTLLAFLWTKLPLPFSVIYTLNLFAAVCTAVSAVLFFQVTLFILRYVQSQTIFAGLSSKKKKEKKADTISLAPLNNFSLLLISFAATLTYSFARTIWAQATAIEVYALHLVMINLALGLFLKAILTNTTPEKGSEKSVLLEPFLIWAFVLGLGFTNHLTMILLAPAMIYLYFKRFGFDRSSFQRIALMTIPFAAGLCIYGYLPLRSAAEPELNWGEVHRNLDKFLYHVQGKQFQVNMFNGNWQPQAKLFFEIYGFQLAFIGFLPMLLGAVRLWTVARDIFWFLMWLIIGCTAYSVNYNIHDIDSYFALAFLASIIVMSIGLLFFFQRQPKLVYAALLIPLLSVGLNYKASDRSQDTLVLDYTKSMIQNLEPNAVIISAQWDYFCSAFWYLQTVEGYRQDVVLIEKELLRRTWYVRQVERLYPAVAGKSKPEIDQFMEDLEKFESQQSYNSMQIQTRYLALINSFVARNLAERPVYATIDVFQSEPEFARAYNKTPQGFAFQLTAPDAKLPSFKADLQLEGFFALAPNGHLEKGIMQTAAAELQALAQYAAAAGKPDDAAKCSAAAARLASKAK
jgi:hypothetical protein